MLSGHAVFASVPPDSTSSGIAMLTIPWPPVCEPETPRMPRTCRDMPWPAGRGNLFALLLATAKVAGAVVSAALSRSRREAGLYLDLEIRLLLPVCAP